jgi:hypothetical protein
MDQPDGFPVIHETVVQMLADAVARTAEAVAINFDARDLT